MIGTAMGTRMANLFMAMIDKMILAIGFEDDRHNIP